MDAPELHKTKSTDIAFRDPLSEETRKVRAHLLFAGTFAVLVKAYDLRLTRAPWLDLDIPTDAPQVLEGALSAALVYFLMAFVVYGWQDFRRWRLAGEIQLVHTIFDQVFDARENLRIIASQLDKLASDPSVLATVRSSIERSANALPDLQANFASLRSALRRISWLQWFRVVVVEIAFPLTIGAFGMYKVAPALVPFIQAVVR